MGSLHRGRRRGLALAGLLLFVLVFYLVASRLGTKPPTPDAAQTLAATGIAPDTVPVVHSPVEVVIQPEAGSARLVQVIDGAEKGLRMKVYLVTEDNVVDALKRAAQRGVELVSEHQPRFGGFFLPQLRLVHISGGTQLTG